MSEIDVGNVCICVSGDCRMGTNWPQWHRMVTMACVSCDGKVDGAMAGCK